MKKTAVATCVASGLLYFAAQAHAYEVRCRIVERIGTVDYVVSSTHEGLYSPARFRLQVGVFDDAQSPAPAGGIVGWRGDQQHLDLLGLRSPGRLPNFSFPSGGNGLPETDPFIALTQIDAQRGPQTVVWDCADGVPLPMPQVVIRGRNTFVSVWETTVRSGHCFNERLEFSGTVLVAENWVVVGKPITPVCIPPTPGSVTYTPVNVESRSATCMVYFDSGPPPFDAPNFFYCPANWYRDYFLDSRDFFEFLNSFFNGFADVNCDGVTNSQDVFDFLELFLIYCGF